MGTDRDTMGLVLPRGPSDLVSRLKIDKVLRTWELKSLRISNQDNGFIRPDWN